MSQSSPMTATLDHLTHRYAAILCDVWGVIHNGLEAYVEAPHALTKARARGLAVVLVTNAPRRADDVERQLDVLGVARSAYDRIVTSGDVTRHLISAGARQVLHIGPERDLTIYDGLDVDLVEEPEAATVVCTGLYDDTVETPEDYGPLLSRLRSRDIPFICANPDIVVERGHELVWCAGALARDYGLLGGRTLISGKPHRLIYEAALAAAGEVLGREVSAAETLAIGDGMLTDVKGAAEFGIDVLYVSGGIHARDYGEVLSPDPARLAVFLESHGRTPVAVMPRLR